MRSFVYTANPARVVFGSGSVNKLPEEVRRLGLQRPLVLSTPEQTSQADLVESILKSAGIESAGQFNGAVMHTPLDVTEKALAVVSERSADGVISIGGGSTIGLGKVRYSRDCCLFAQGINNINILSGYCIADGLAANRDTDNVCRIGNDAYNWPNRKWRQDNSEYPKSPS